VLGGYGSLPRNETEGVEEPGRDADAPGVFTDREILRAYRRPHAAGGRRDVELIDLERLYEGD
jgi:hypothetical protein